MRFIVDSREPERVKNKLMLTDHVVEVKELPQADFYMPERDVAVERKEASDFASSMTDGRLSEQADRMAAEHDYNFLVLEGSPYELRYSNVNSSSFIGMQASLAVKRGFRTIYTEGIEDTCYAVLRIFERFDSGQHDRGSSGYVKTADTGEVDDVQVAMLMQIEGISKDKAEAIIDRVGGVGSFVWAYNEGANVESDLKEVEGVGDVLADRVIKSFS